MSSHRRIGCSRRSASSHRMNGCFRRTTGCRQQKSASCRRKTGCYPLTGGSCFRRIGCPQPSRFGVLNSGRNSCQPNSAIVRSSLATTKIPMATLWGGCRARNSTQARSPAVSCQPSRSLFAVRPAVAILPKNVCRLLRITSRHCRHTWSAGRRWAVKPSMSSTNGTETLPRLRGEEQPFYCSRPRPRSNAG